MKLGRLFWALIFIVGGFLLLGINLQWWDANVWQNIIVLWPLLLVLIGVNIIFGEESPVTLLIAIILILSAFVWVTNKPFQIRTTDNQIDLSPIRSVFDKIVK